MAKKLQTGERAGFAAQLLGWYGRQARVLPWRVPPGSGKRADPYRVWLSEIMLQQTTVAAVGPYFARFLQRWPTLADLAVAPLDDVLHAWAGLGYYSRARNLHACAVQLAASGGAFPQTEAELLQLKGVGGYTAAAIASIAFGQKATVVDGNVERVVARLFRVETPLPLAKIELKKLAAIITPDHRAGDYAQAMMDLGATVCTPRNPKCMVCPVRDHCAAFAAGVQDQLPRRAPKLARPERRGIAYWLEDAPIHKDGRVLLRRRPPTGLLGGMVEVPSSDWREDELPEIGTQAPLDADWIETGRRVRHVFTHFGLELEIVRAVVRRPPALPAPYLWATLAQMDVLALPTAMRKIIDAMIADTQARA